ncbi:MAG TPA: NUDIX domain-containing protein [Candidatus Saccharimonadales bacterium]|jgi:ADP-ribose pyrophosphatase YjhB (NUDIX family)|nr:NUDIX domain-containing protein [Candidatus Saccharimonadales bacterium]
MGKAARAIIIEDGNLLLMLRNKEGMQYYTLVGGQAKQDEDLKMALAREVKEETGLEITSARLVFTEKHASPYNEQYIYLCTVAPHSEAAIQETSEEGLLNKIGINTHAPVWAHPRAFAGVQFRTPQLHQAILDALQNGFPGSPVELTSR